MVGKKHPQMLIKVNMCIFDAKKLDCVKNTHYLCVKITHKH